MKIKTQDADFASVLALSREKHKAPKRPNLFFRTLVRLVGAADLKDASFSYTVDDDAKAALKEPCLILMNHSSFIDLEIVSRILYPKPYQIVCTSDGFVGKEWLMRNLGCIPTKKFVPDLTLIKDMKTALLKKRTSVLMYPEASYSFDGCATPLPEHFPGLIKSLGVPVIMIKTEGAFLRDPLYNYLQKRKVAVSAHVSLLVAKEEVGKPAEEIAPRLNEAFTFDAFAQQKENGIRVTEPFRADGLERILYRCPDCECENTMVGKGTKLTCNHCGKTYELTELGELEAKDGNARFSHIPDWYRWERECVKNEVDEGRYSLSVDVDIAVMVNYDAIYRVGSGHLTHDGSGFSLNGEGFDLHYEQKPQASYGLYADYFWYEIGDVICIGNNDILYYCFPKEKCAVAKARLAQEELFRKEHKKIYR